MRKYVLCITLMMGFALPALAEESECKTIKTQPSSELVQLVEDQYPDLTQDQAVTIAGSFDTLFRLNQEASNEALSEADRAFAERLETLVYKALAFQLRVYQTLPEVEAVLELMEAEKSTGLTQVSSELLPRVQALGLEISDNSLIWGGILVETSALAADRYKALDDTKNLTERTKDMEAIDPLLCMVKKGLDVFIELGHITIDIIPMSHIDRITYN